MHEQQPTPDYDDQEVRFEDPDNPQSFGSQVSSFNGLILEQLRRIAIAGSQELRGGRYERIYKGPQVVLRYVPDTRAVYISAINTLYDLLVPRFTDEMRAADKAVKGKLETLNRKFSSQADDDADRERRNQDYRNRRAEIYRELLRALSQLIADKKIFDNFGIGGGG